jgi:hypothetical protein
MRQFVSFLVSKQFGKQLLLLALTLSVGLFVLSYSLDMATHHNQKIQVPSLSKLQLDKVSQVLSELDLRYEVIDSASYNPEYPKKSVLDQFPQAGSYVKEKRKIYLTLNPSQYGLITVPDFYGKTKNEVEAQLRSLGFVVGVHTYIPDLGKNVVRKLVCDGRNLEKGIKMPKKSVIDLVLGDGKKQ